MAVRPDLSENWITESRRRLAARAPEKPATKAGQIRALWPQIRLALDQGQSLKTIHHWLQPDACVTLGITTFTSCVSRIRRKGAVKQRSIQQSEFALEGARSNPTSNDVPADQAHHFDPLAQAMQALSKLLLDRSSYQTRSYDVHFVSE